MRALSLLLGGLAPLLLLGGCAAPSGVHGLEATVTEVYLQTQDPAVADAVLRRAQARFGELDLDAAIAAAVPRAAERAQAFFASYPAVASAIAALTPAEVGLEVDPERPVFHAEAVLQGSRSASVSAAALGEPVVLPPSDRLYARLTLRLIPWPRDPERFEPAPGLILAQAGLQYMSDLPAAGLVAQALAEELAAWAADLVEQAAAAMDLPVERR